MTTTTNVGGGVSIAAPAKINLCLHVLGKRADGYHLLDSLVGFVGVGDVIAVAPSATLKLAMTGPFAGALANEGDNLVLRAARLLQQRFTVTSGANITLVKNLPVASGIGGGSADAAAALKALAQLWHVTPHFTDAEIAKTLGADVPVCLAGIPAFMAGIGEEIAPAPHLPPAWLLLVNPGVPLPTQSVFGALAGRFSAPLPRTDLAGLENAEALAKVLGTLRNDLTAPACEIEPAIATVLKALEGTGGCLLARMCGSGPTCFGLFASEKAAQSAGAAIRQTHAGWWIAAAPLLTGPS